MRKDLKTLQKSLKEKSDKEKNVIERIKNVKENLEVKNIVKTLTHYTKKVVDDCSEKYHRKQDIDVIKGRLKEIMRLEDRKDLTKQEKKNVVGNAAGFLYNTFYKDETSWFMMEINMSYNSLYNYLLSMKDKE